MAGPGGGPCRRSHTKSRKGCKTCKKRHIRCDETFPQCRNCTKHQVRCDYMDSPTIISPTSPKSPRQPNLLWTAEIEATIDLWRQTGEFPFPELRVYPQPQWHIMSKTDLRLIHHLSSIANEMFRSNTSKMTVWADMMPKFLGLAASHPFVMHSILAFSASHIAWIAQSTETRSLAVHHGGLAWKGLHEALPTYSKQNSDAVLAASLLLAWQATDWRGWAQLVTDTQMIISTMQPWRNESVFAEYIAEHGVLRQNFNSAASALITPDARRDHLQTLQSISHSLQRLQPYLMRHEQESKWIDQLRSHIDRLKTFNPPQTSEEQFQQLYPLRKWLFWVPISLLSTRRGDVIVMTVLAHFYATTLALEPLFPDIGGAFCANLALPPLEEIIHIIGSLQSSPGYTPTAQAALVLMDFPRDIAQSYRTSRDWVKQQADDYQHSPYTMETFNFDPQTHMAPYSYGASLSPMFASSPLSYVPPTMISGQSSPYLEVPRSSIDFGTINFSTYSTTPLVSPVAPPIAYTQEESALHFGMPTVGFPGGFVAPAIWTEQQYHYHLPSPISSQPYHVRRVSVPRRVSTV